MPLIDPVTTSGAGQDTAPKASMPIELLPNDLARAFTHIQPIALLALFYVRFPALVADPVNTLWTSLIPLAAIQVAYVVICLPTALAAGPKPPKKKKLGGSNKAHPESASLAGQASTVVIALLLSAVGVPILTAIQILFGAPVTTHLNHTLLSSTHIALLAGLPLTYVHGVDPGKWREIASASLPIDEAFGGAIGSLVGAWLGAIPIPLDWDREWQKWPITIVTGAYLGYVVGKTVGRSLLKGKRIEFD